MAKFRITIDENAKPISLDTLCRCLVGLNVKEFAEEIRQNKDGKYDCLYEEDSK